MPDGNVMAFAIGSADTVLRTPLTPTSKMLAGSVGKTFFAALALQLVDEGRLDLDAPISTYLTSVWGEFKTDITVAQLLSNSAGMVGLLDDPTYAPYLCQYLSGGSLADCARTIYVADDATDRVPPDTAFRYGGGAWQLAGGIAEVVSGKTWAELVEEIYVVPCDLNVLAYANQYQQAFLSGGGVGGALSYPTFFDGDPADLTPTSNPSIEGGGYTTVRDYGELLLMQLRGGVCPNGRVMSEQAVARMQTDRIGEVYGGVSIDPRFEGYGFGWWVSRTEPGVVSDGGAYGATPWLDVERGYGVMVILEASAMTTGNLYGTLKPIVDRIFDAMPPPG
jgi:CubicO group peptidase (beta-lactamase class C family)